MTDAGGRMVVGYDGSGSADAALEWAVRQAAASGAVLEVVTAWRWPTSYGAPVPVPSDYDPAGDAAKLLDEGLAKVRSGHPELVVRPRVVEGPAAQVLVDASAGADLLVVGSRGHGELAGMLLGSVSEHCTAHAHCPVLVVRKPA